jgi:hypothetical protein
VLAARRDVFDRVGRFDERFPFEYEETEWEQRVTAAGMRLVVAPRASVRHLWARSSSRNPEAGARRAASERTYRQRRYGRWGRALLDRIRAPAGPPMPRLQRPQAEASPGHFLAISPNPSRVPFAAAELDRDFELPREIAEELPPGNWRFTRFREADGRPIETRVWEKAP